MSAGTTSSAARPSRLPHHPDVGLGVEDHAEAGAQEALIVGYDHIDLAGARPRAASLCASPAQRTCVTLTRRRCPQAAARPPAPSARRAAGPRSGATTSEARISPPAAVVAEATGDYHRRCRRGRLRREAARRRRGPTLIGRPFSAAVARRCMSTAHRTAATALANATIKPSPVDFTSRPPCSAIARRRASKWSRRMASACSSPPRSNSAGSRRGR